MDSTEGVLAAGVSAPADAANSATSRNVLIIVLNTIRHALLCKFLTPIPIVASQSVSFLKDALGNLSFHTTATYVSTITLQDASGSYLQLAGSMEQPTIQSIGGQPHFRGNFTTTYGVGPTTLSATARYVGGGKLRNEWGPLDINQVTSSSRTYLDVFGSRDVLSEPYPGLRQGEPQGLVSVALGSACHRYALLGELPMIVVGPHFTSPTYAILRG